LAEALKQTYLLQNYDSRLAVWKLPSPKNQLCRKDTENRKEKMTVPTGCVEERKEDARVLCALCWLDYRLVVWVRYRVDPE
jgi:hypothetical protein